MRDGARVFLQGENTSEQLRALANGGNGLNLWSALSEMGFLGAAASEDAGGLGLSATETLLLCEEAGRAGLPAPYSDTAAVLIPALQSLGGQAADLVPDLISGALRGVVVHDINPLANYAENADFALVVSSDSIKLCQKGEFTVSPLDSIDPGRKVGTVLTEGGVELTDRGRAETIASDMAARGALAAAAELCGLTSRMIDLATDYSKTREQFGKPIGSFQAVKHLMANAQVQLEFARPVVYHAGATLDAPTGLRDLAVAHAKIAAGDAAMLAAENAIQVFGGMGYTFEVDLHFFMKRAWALCGVWGDRSHHMQIVDTSLFASNKPIGPGETFNPQTAHQEPQNG